MPQGRRKTPFSGKQKKNQILEKRDRKRCTSGGDEDEKNVGAFANYETAGSSSSSINNFHATDLLINAQQNRSNSSNVNRYALQFRRETDEEIRRRKALATVKLPPVSVKNLEVRSEDIFILPELGLPKRPPWSNSMSVDQLEAREHKYFREYVNKLEHEFSKHGQLGYFELNLETWRQLWRVLEMSDIVLLITDIRYPIFHFPPALYDYVVDELKKDIIIVVNKVDLVSTELVLAWINYLKEKFPKIHVTPFASYAGMKQKQSGKSRGQRIGKLRMASKSAQLLLEICEKIVNNQVDLSSWREKITDELREEEESAVGDSDEHDAVDDASENESENDDEFNPLKTGEQKQMKYDLSYYESVKYKDGVLTIGCVGHPNVGKSSLLNAIMGKKVVSVSRTPGHTKHFQTIFLTNTVKLCDCPGLVFPSLASKEIQTLMGCFPIAHLREPYSSIAYIAERIDLIKLLHLTHPAHDRDWSAMDICEVFAKKRGFTTAKSGRPDVYRSANCLLRMALDGRTLCLAFYPPDFLNQLTNVWSKHSDYQKIQYLQCQTSKPILTNNFAEFDKRTNTTRKESTSESSDDDSDAGDDALQPITNKFALLDEIDD